MKLKLVFLTSVIIFVSCTGNKKSGSAICIEKRAALYETSNIMDPSEKVLNLGDRVSITDFRDFEKKRSEEFIEITLSDGSSAWTLKRNLIPGGTPAAVIKDTPAYAKPDTNVVTAMFRLAEFAAITETQDDRVKITGAGRIKEGWTLKKNISMDSVDIEIAILAHEELLDKNSRIIKEALPYFLSIVSDKQSILSGELQKLMDAEVSNAIEESIMQYEGVQ